MAVFVTLTIIGVCVVNNPALLRDCQMRAKYWNRIEKLPVPYFHQEHSLSCEIACLKMALAYQGASVTERDLLALLPKDSTRKSKDCWGDPDQGFVGDIDGDMGVNGYGVYWKPIAQLGRHWRETQILQHGTVQDLAANVIAKRPVIIWGYAGSGAGKKLDWKTPSGKKVCAISNEHTRVVTGFAGDQTNPEVFFVLDPAIGELTWSRDELEKNWQSLGHCGVIVFPQAADGSIIKG